MHSVLQLKRQNNYLGTYFGFACRLEEEGEVGIWGGGGGGFAFNPSCLDNFDYSFSIMKQCTFKYTLIELIDCN